MATILVQNGTLTGDIVAGTSRGQGPGCSNDKGAGPVRRTLHPRWRSPAWRKSPLPAISSNAVEG